MWFKVYADHGGGHQSYTEEYVWRTQRPPAYEREEMWKDMVNRNYLSNALGGVRLVRKLPEEVRLEKIERFKREIVYSMEMLKILGAPVLEPFVF